MIVTLGAIAMAAGAAPLDFLSPGFIVSSVTGGGMTGGAVWLAVRLHLHFIWREFGYLRKELEAVREDIKELRRARGVMYGSNKSTGSSGGVDGN